MGTGEPVTEHEARLPGVVLGVLAVATVATWWGWPPSLIEMRWERVKLVGDGEPVERAGL